MIRSAASTNVGRVHSLNEDSLGADPEHGVWLVTDGMGGHAAGEVASRVARDTILAEIVAGRDLRDATLAAHAAVVREAASNDAQKGMGTTSVVLRIRDAQCEMVWVGDSRGYLFRAGELTQLTKDHSFMQLLIDRRHLTPEQARTHPKRNVVTQVLGYGDPVPDSVTCPLQQGDVLMLCSDGLYDELSDPEIGDIMRAQTDLQSCVDQLVNAACDRGGRDNISTVLVRYDGASAVTQPEIAPDPHRTTVVRGRAVTGGVIGGTTTAATTGKQSNQPRRKGVWLILALVVIVALLAGLMMTGHLGDMT
jgi:PPM family protein phosphatase